MRSKKIFSHTFFANKLPKPISTKRDDSWRSKEEGERMCGFSSLWLFFARSKSQAWKERALKKGRVHCPLKIDGGAEPKKVKSARSYKCTRALSEKAFPDWLQKMCHCLKLIYSTTYLIYTYIVYQYLLIFLFSTTTRPWLMIFGPSRNRVNHWLRLYVILL